MRLALGETAAAEELLGRALALLWSAYLAVLAALRLDLARVVLCGGGSQRRLERRVIGGGPCGRELGVPLPRRGDERAPSASAAATSPRRTAFLAAASVGNREGNAASVASARFHLPSSPAAKPLGSPAAPPAAGTSPESTTACDEGFAIDEAARG